MNEIFDPMQQTPQQQIEQLEKQVQELLARIAGLQKQVEDPGCEKPPSMTRPVFSFSMALLQLEDSPVPVKGDSRKSALAHAAGLSIQAAQADRVPRL